MFHTVYHRARRFLPFLLKNIIKFIARALTVLLAIVAAILFLMALYQTVSFLGNSLTIVYPGLTINERFILGMLIIFAFAAVIASICMTVIWIFNESLKDYRAVYKTKKMYNPDDADDILETAEVVSSFDDTQEIKRN